MNPWFGVAIMATVTHLMRAVPLLAIRRRITNQWMLSFLHHLPYAVLSAMAFPAVLTDEIGRASCRERVFRAV